jgi:hypothetical protein
MEWLKAIEAMAAPWWAYVSWCVEADISAPVCKPFWTWVSIACVAVGSVALAIMVVRFVSFRIKLAAAMRAEKARNQVADRESMQRYQWQGDNANPDNETAEELARRIKDELDQRKRQ